MQKNKKRQGAALVEFAVCLPVLMLVIVGAMEASHTIFLKQGLHAAAYEAIREAVRRRSDDGLANQRATDILTARSIRGAKVTFTPAAPSIAPVGTQVIVEVSAPVSANSPFIGKVIADRTLVSRVVMLKE